MRSGFDGRVLTLVRPGWAAFSTAPAVCAVPCGMAAAVLGTAMVTGDWSQAFVLAVTLPVVLAVVIGGLLDNRRRLVVRISADGIDLRRGRSALSLPWSAVDRIGSRRRMLGDALVVQPGPGGWLRDGLRRFAPTGRIVAHTGTFVLAEALLAAGQLAPPSVPVDQQPGERPGTGRVAVAAGLYTALVGLLFATPLAVWLALIDPVGRAAPATAPACDALSASTVASLVPAAGAPEPDPGAVQGDDGYRRSACWIETGRGASGARAAVGVEISSYGTSYGLTGERRASRDFVAGWNALAGRAGAAPVRLTGLGDQAYAEVVDAEDGTADVRVLVTARRGADLVTVRYHATPTTADRTLAGAGVAAREVLGGLR